MHELKQQWGVETVIKTRRTKMTHISEQPAEVAADGDKKKKRSKEEKEQRKQRKEEKKLKVRTELTHIHRCFFKFITQNSPSRDLSLLSPSRFVTRDLS